MSFREVCIEYRDHCNNPATIKKLRERYGIKRVMDMNGQVTPHLMLIDESTQHIVCKFLFVKHTIESGFNFQVFHIEESQAKEEVLKNECETLFKIPVMHYTVLFYCMVAAFLQSFNGHEPEVGI